MEKHEAAEVYNGWPDIKEICLDGHAVDDPADIVTVGWKRLRRGILRVRIDYHDGATYTGIAFGQHKKKGV